MVVLVVEVTVWAEEVMETEAVAEAVVVVKVREVKVREVVATAEVAVVGAQEETRKWLQTVEKRCLQHASSLASQGAQCR